MHGLLHACQNRPGAIMFILHVRPARFIPRKFRWLTQELVIRAPKCGRDSGAGRLTRFCMWEFFFVLIFMHVR